MYTVITSAWNQIPKHFFPIFTTPAAQVFTALISGWVLCTDRHTVTGIVPFAAEFLAKPHDVFHRFFNKARWQLPSFWKVLTLLLVKMLCPKGNINLDVDDTLFRRAGKHVQGASKLIFAKKIIWYHVSKKPLLMVITGDPSGKRPDDFFITTDLTMKGEQVVSGFSGRWSIEDTFKNTK